MGKFEGIQHNPDIVVLTNCISQIVANLDYEISAGSDGICAEYVNFLNDKIHTFLSLCVTVCLFHGFLPHALIETTIVPIVKTTFGNPSDSNNYRPIPSSFYYL